jgi:hypothetical protein
VVKEQAQRVAEVLGKSKFMAFNKWPESFRNSDQLYLIKSLVKLAMSVKKQ